MSGGIGETGSNCFPGPCIVKVFDVLASLYVRAYQYEYSGIHNGRPIDGGGVIDDTIVGACFADTFSLEQMVNDICYIYRIERQYKADGVYFYRNAMLDEPTAIAATIDENELADSLNTGDGIRYAVSTTFLDSSNAVTKIAFNFLDADNDFKPNQLTAKAPDAVQTDPEKQITLPFVMVVDEAETLVNRLLADNRLSLTQHSFRLPPRYGWLGKGDVVVIKHGIFTDTVRITQTDFNKDKSQSVSAVTVATATNEVPLKNRQSVRTKVGGVVVDSEPMFFDIPTLVPSEGLDAPNQFEMYYSVAPKFAGYWLGAYLARQLTKDSERYATLFHSYGKNIAGQYIARWRATNALTNKRWVTDSDVLELSASNGGYSIDRNTSKAAIDANAMINLAVYGAPGRWEIIQFERVVDNVMSGIVRGLRGTEGNCGNHEPGDYIYTLSPNLAISRLNKSYIGSSAKYRAVSETAQFILSEQIQAPPFVGNSRKPFGPYHFRGTKGEDGAITFTWLRRDRGGSGWGKALTMSEGSLAYDVDVCTAIGFVLSTHTVNTESFVYTTEMQQADGSTGFHDFVLNVRQHGDIVMGFDGSEFVNV